MPKVASLPADLDAHSMVAASRLRRVDFAGRGAAGGSFSVNFADAAAPSAANQRTSLAIFSASLSQGLGSLLVNGSRDKCH